MQLTGCTTLGALQSLLILCLPHMVVRDLFSGLVLPYETPTPNLMEMMIPVWFVGIKLIILLMPGQQNIPLEPDCEHFSFLDKCIKEFEHGLDFIFTGYVNTVELNVSSNEPDAIASSILLDILWMVSAHPESTKARLASSIQLH